MCLSLCTTVVIQNTSKGILAVVRNPWSSRRSDRPTVTVRLVIADLDAFLGRFHRDLCSFVKHLSQGLTDLRVMRDLHRHDVPSSVQRILGRVKLSDTTHAAFYQQNNRQYFIHSTLILLLWWQRGAAVT